MTSSWLTKHISIKRIISVTALTAFLASVILPDARAAMVAGAAPHETAPRGHMSLAPLNPDTFTLPSHLGEIRDRWCAPSHHPPSTSHYPRKTIIHIQDAHCNYSCQQSINGIIEHLNREYGIDLALLEGGAGDYDLSVFTDIEDKALRSNVADYFVKEGRVNGAELFAINNPGKVTLKGLEEPELYIKHLSAYRQTLKYKQRVDQILNILGHYLTELKRNIYLDGLKEFDQNRAWQKDKKTELNEYLGYLAGLAGQLDIDISQRENLHKISAVLGRERNIDFKKADSEKKVLIDKLTKRMSRAEIDILVKNTLHFKEGLIRQSDFFSYLFRKARSIDMDPHVAFPDLSKYRSYVEIYESMDKRALFKEIAGIEDEMAEKLCVNDAQRKLYKLSKDLSLLNKLFNASLTIDEYRYYRENKRSLTTGRFLSFVRAEAPKYRIAIDAADDIMALDMYTGRMGRFYEIAFERDRAFMRNIDACAGDKDRMIVLSGGFHGENLGRMLKEKGYSYVSIMPCVDASGESPYFSLLSGGLLKEERLIKSAVSAIAIQSMFSEMNVCAGVDDVSKLAVLLRKATDQNKQLVLEIRDQSGNFTKRVIFKKNTGGEYEREDIENPAARLDLPTDPEAVEAAEVKVSTDNGILSIQTKSYLSRSPGKEITSRAPPAIDMRKVSVESVSPGYDLWLKIKSDVMRVTKVMPEKFMHELDRYFLDSKAISAILKYDDRVIGYVVGGPLEWYPHCHDDNYGKKNTAYICLRGVLSEFQGYGLGPKLQREFFKIAGKRGCKYVAHHQRKGFVGAGEEILAEFLNWDDRGNTFQYSRRVLIDSIWRKLFRKIIGKKAGNVPVYQKSGNDYRPVDAPEQGNEAVQQIGKRAKVDQVIERGGEKYLRVVDARDESRVLDEIELTRWTSSAYLPPALKELKACPAGDRGTRRDEVLEAFLEMLENSPPEYYVFTRLVGDLFG